MRTARVRAVAFAMAAAVLAALAWAALTGRWPGGSGRSAEARAIARASAVLPGRAVWGHLLVPDSGQDQQGLGRGKLAHAREEALVEMGDQLFTNLCKK